MGRGDRMVDREECSTCTVIRMTKALHLKDERRLRYKYYARILERTERDLNLDGEWVFAGDYTWRPSPFNYCPECGRKVKWDAAD